MSRVIDEHRRYIDDHVRIEAFRRAISDVVRPGDVVVDLGSGTGVLGLFACQAGAGRVYSLELTSIIGLARDICRANGFSDRVTFIKDYSRWTKLPELADVVICDQMGHFGFEAGIFEFYSDARRRFLKADGRTVPSQIDLFAGPIESSEFRRRVDFWKSPQAGLDVSPVHPLARNSGYPARIEAEELLGEPVLLASLDPVAGVEIVEVAGSTRIERDGTLHGIGGWFSAQLSPGSRMTNSPLAEERIERRNVIVPLDEPTRVSRGDRVDMSLKIWLMDVMVSWDVVVSDANGATKASFRHSTFEGMLVCKEDLQRTKLDSTPMLTPRGEARRTILSLCDGQRPLAEIEHEVALRHPALFRNAAEAAVFVAEVVTRYTV